MGTGVGPPVSTHGATYDVRVAETLTDPLLGRLIDGRYEVRERIAAGGMATVYVAFDRRLERHVAVKVMHTTLGSQSERHEFASRFRREAKAAARLTHPGMVRVYDQGTDGEISYLTMEYVDGGNLRAYLTREGTLPVGEALSITESVLDALAAAHRQNLVHRDVKPENVLLDEDKRPRLADFGLARAVTEVTSTSTGTLLGTVAYLAPELVQNGDADSRSDIYAVGVLLFEMLTGRQPFTGSSAIDVAARHVHEDVPAPSTFVTWLPAEIDDLVARLTARQPVARPADATMALSILRQTRAMIDDPTLDRRAEPPSGPIPLASDKTDVIDPVPTSSTIALPIGLGETGFVPVEAEIVFDDDPEAVEPVKDRRRIGMWIGAVVGALLVIAAFVGWWYNTQGPGAYTTVPPVAGESTASARLILQQAGLSVNVLSEYSDTVPEDIAIRTDPDAQSQILKGGDVNLIISKGPRMSVVPPVTGILEDDAIKILEDAGFAIGSKERVYSDVAPAGEVISTDPAADASVRHDSAINLVISDGPQPITMPDIIGKSESEARAVLDEHKLNVVVENGRSADVERGEVYQSDPAPGDGTTRTATVTIWVSVGKPIVTVPNFIYDTVSDARAQAIDLGLEPNFRPLFGNGKCSDDMQVLGQSPDPNKEVEMGTAVSMSCYKP